MYFEVYEKEIGFSKVTLNLWPGISEAETLLTKILEIAPLDKYFDDETRKTEEYGLWDRLKRKIYNKNESRKRVLKITKGMYSMLPYKHGTSLIDF